MAERGGKPDRRPDAQHQADYPRCGWCCGARAHLGTLIEKECRPSAARRNAGIMSEHQGQGGQANKAPVLPCTGTLPVLIVPWCCSVIQRAIGEARPVPHGCPRAGSLSRSALERVAAQLPPGVGAGESQ